MSSGTNKNSTPSNWRSLWQRAGELYLRGLLVLLVLLLAGYLISSIAYYLEGVDADPRIVGASLVAILLLPLPLGWLQHRYLRGRLARMRSGRALGRMEDRLVAELALDERRGYPVVLINFPNKEIRSLGLVTALVAGNDPDSEFAMVFLPKGPGYGLKGNIRIVNVKELEYTDWSLQAFLQHHLTFGSSTPGNF